MNCSRGVKIQFLWPLTSSVTEGAVLSEVTKDYLWNLLKVEVIKFSAMDTPRIALGGIVSTAVKIDHFSS
jgi:hypothetical protein